MSGLDYFLAVLLLGALALIAYLLLGRGKASLDPRMQSTFDSLAGIQRELGALRATVQSLPSEATLRAIETRLNTIDSRVPSSLESNLQRLDAALGAIQSEYRPGNRFEQIHQATNRLVGLLAGGRGRGTAGETLVAEVLRVFPPMMLERDFKVNGKSVEFALILPNGKRLPIDSKWTAAEAVEKLSNGHNGDSQEKLIAEIERVVLTKAAEVAKYRNAAATVDLGIAAIPDAVYGVCVKAHLLAYEQWSVLIVPYSMLAPYLLAFYNLHLRYGQAIELANLQAYLSVIEQEVRSIDADLEGRIKEAGTRVNNAYESIKNALAKIRAASEYLKSAPSLSDSEQANAMEQSAR